MSMIKVYFKMINIFSNKILKKQNKLNSSLDLIYAISSPQKVQEIKNLLLHKLLKFMTCPSHINKTLMFPALSNKLLHGDQFKKLYHYFIL